MRGVVVLEPEFVRLQIETVLGDFAVRSVKTGMLATEPSSTWWPTWLRPGGCPQLVVDPGPGLLQRARAHGSRGLEAYLTRLLPHALVVTPNLREAAALTGTDRWRT